MHEQQSAALDKEMLELTEKEKDLEEKIDIAEKELKKRQVTPRSDVKEIRYGNKERKMTCCRIYTKSKRTFYSASC